MIAFVTTNTITCGGIIVIFEYVSRLKKLGYDSDIFAEEGNPALEEAYGIKVRPLSHLQTAKDDVIIAVRWEQCEQLTTLPGKKYQFVQGDDIVLINPGQREKCTYWRTHTDWELIGVSRYVLMRWDRGVVIPNGLSERFKTDFTVTKDIDILIEGNNEPNKNVDEAINIAKKVKLYLPNIKIAWLGRDVKDVEGIELFTGDTKTHSGYPLADVPKIYQRSKVMIKLSKSEGFCLPVLEAMASGCLVATTNMGGNDAWCVHEKNCIMDNYVNEIKEHLEKGKHEWVVERGKMTAKEFPWSRSVYKLINTVGL